MENYLIDELVTKTQFSLVTLVISNNTSLFIDPRASKNLTEDFFVNVKLLPISIPDWLHLVNQIKTQVLGVQYQCSINIISDQRIRSLNKTWRQKNTTTDVLSFPYSNHEGEVFIANNFVSKNYAAYNRTLGNFVLYIINHSLHHLKGFEHGPEMTKAEQEINNFFGI